MTAPHGPLAAASHAEQLASRMPDTRLAFVCNGLSVCLLGTMLFREFRDLLRDKGGHVDHGGRRR